jgi:hypothetical protein
MVPLYFKKQTFGMRGIWIRVIFKFNGRYFEENTVIVDDCPTMYILNPV